MKQKTPAMKWLVCFTLALAIAGFASADTAPQSEPKETRLCWSLFWGAYTRPGCPQPVKNDVKSSKSVTKKSEEELGRIEQKKSDALSKSEETKSILFGAIQWTKTKPSKVESRDAPH
jgi:hypothetical protein